MQSYILLISLIVASIIALDSSRIHQNELDFDIYSLNELFQRRSSSDFTKTQLKFQKHMLDAHNKYRARHCTPPLELDNELNLSAQKYAEHLAHTHTFDHSDSDILGENLFKKTSTWNLQDLDGATPTSSWYNEIALYNYSNPVFSEATGHFTQIVWKDTQNIGVGIAFTTENSKYAVYVVAQYSPSGNYKNEFAANVLKPNC